MDTKKLGTVAIVIGGLMTAYYAHCYFTNKNKKIVLDKNEDTPMNRSTAEFAQDEKVKDYKRNMTIGAVILAGGVIARYSKK